MDTATKMTKIGADSGRSTSEQNDLMARKRQIVQDKLDVCRAAIARVDTADKESWSTIVTELLEGGFTEAELETELAASRNTIYKWKSGLAAPREMTRRLLQRSILEMVDERMAIYA